MRLIDPRGYPPVATPSLSRNIMPRKQYKLNMKKILFPACMLTLLVSTGCLISERPRHEHYSRHESYRSEPAVIVAPAPAVVVVRPPPPPVVIVRPPVLVVRPPEVIVR